MGKPMQQPLWLFSIDMLIRDELPFDLDTFFERICLDASDWTLMMEIL